MRRNTASRPSRESEAVPVASISTPNDPYWSYAWHLKNTGFAQGQTAVAGVDVGALEAWPRSQGNGVVVAVIDTGYYSAHPDLTGALWTNPKEACGSTDTDGDGHAGDCHGWNLYRDSADVDNDAGGEHGTTVAGVIAAQLDNGTGSAGLAPQAKIMPIVAGSGTDINMAMATEGIYYAVDHGADIINASFGGTLSGTALTSLTNAVSYARSHGVLVVTAAGNDNVNRDTSAMYPANLTLDNVVTVGSSDASDNKSDFSAWGKTNVDLFAPGTSVVTTFNDGDYRLVSGTSIASPLVAAAAALAKSANPSMTPAQLRTALMSTGDHPTALANLSVSGARLSAGRLLAGTLRYTVDNGTGLVANTPGAVTVTATGSAPSASPAMKLTLAYRQDGGTWAVSGVEVETSAGTRTTSDDGSVIVPVTGTAVDGGATAQVQMSLPKGDFALLSQLMSDGEPVGRPAVVILPVGAAAGTQLPGDGGDGSATQPAAGATPTSSSGVPGQPTASATIAPTTGGLPTSTTSAPASAVPTSAPSTPSTTTATTTSRPAPPRTVSLSPTTAATGDSGQSSPTTSPTSSSPGTGGGSGGDGAGNDPTTNPGSGSTATTPVVTPAPVPTKTFPGSDVFGVTSLSPSTVNPAGGTIVTISGTHLPAAPRVTVAGVMATVMGGNSATQLAFYAPARAEGTYDVVLSEYPATTSVTLPNALTYSASASAGNGGSGSGGGGTGQPTAQPSTSPTPSGSTPTSSPVTATSPLTVTGPGGLRLVRSDALAALTASVWDAAPGATAGVRQLRCEDAHS